jgi:uncharacterized protein YjdB
LENLQEYLTIINKTLRRFMKRIILIIIILNAYAIVYGQVIADHTVVDKFDEIPQYYINEVKKMWVSYTGESHSIGVRNGLASLAAVNPTYAVDITTNPPRQYTDANLRFNGTTWGDVSTATGWITNSGEEDWYTSELAIARKKAGLLYCHTNGPALSAFGYGWCWDQTQTEGNPTTNADPVYGVHWYGRSAGSPQGDRPWGLDADDFAVTGNSVSLDSYLNATQEYINYCAANGIPTKVFFTTGPVDTYTGEAGYQGYLKNERIRAYVDAHPSAILFDYADILCYDDNGALTTTTWNGHTYPIITPTNELPVYSGHISQSGGVRIAKAMWWMLARMAGWDGGTASVPVSGISVTGEGGSSIITTDNGTLQLTATISPTNATNQAVTWSIVNGTGQATISTSGLVTAVSNGTVTARATATDGSGVVGSLVITISGQIIPITGITVTGAGGSSIITTDNGTLQLTATISPTNATNQAVTWSVVNGTGEATISTSGLVTAVSSGTVTARATANDGSGVVGSLVITISGQVIPVTGITVTGAGGSSQITTDNGTLQLTATISPTNATNQTVTWSVANGTGQATISSSGLVTAVSSGTVTARATANDGSGVVGSLVITISGQVIPVTGIAVTGAGGSSIITTDNGTLQLTATISPTNATNQTVTWSVANGTGQATISSSGLVTAVSSGTVTARATANDGSGVVGSLVITISGQVIPVTGITVTGAGGSSQITTDNGTLQLTAAISPTNATNQAVTWSIVNGTGQATISISGLVTAVSSGTVTARATATDGSGVVGSLVITISGQVIPVTGITVTGAGGSTQITTDKGTLQLTATVSPTNATNQAVTWSIVNGTGQATISISGIVTAVSSGTVTARATATDGSGVVGSLVISISNQSIAVTTITVSGEGGASSINTDRGVLQLSATVLPSDASNKGVSWSIINGATNGTVSSSGLVTALSNGSVTVRATASDGKGAYGDFVIAISNQVIEVEGITITGAGGATSIGELNGTLQLLASVTPSNASFRTVSWSIFNGTGMAIISSEGLVTAVSEGSVTARATANDGTGIYDELEIMIEVIEGMKLIRQGDMLIVQIPDSYITSDIRLNNMIGNLISSKKAVSNECVFDVSQCPTGLYIVVVYKPHVLEVAKIMLSR